jgi:methionine synthase II (cobalamin-independent)
MAQPRDRFDFDTRYSRSGLWHRWTMFSTGEVIGTGLERTNQLAREASRKCKAEYRERYSVFSNPNVSRDLVAS